MTRTAYTEFHIRINKTISSSLWTVDEALTDAQVGHDLQLQSLWRIHAAAVG